MPNRAQIQSKIDSFFSESYIINAGRTIPSITDVSLSNHGKEVDLSMLFIDIKESTKIVSGSRRETAAKMYKAFLWGVTQIARANDGEVKSFNGDGVLVVFFGDQKENNAVTAALKMSWFVTNILKPKIQPRFNGSARLEGMDFDFGIGIDSGNVLVVRGGIAGEDNNDLVWVGNPTNYAVKLSSLSKSGSSISITSNVYAKLRDSLKYDKNELMSQYITGNYKNIWERTPIPSKLTTKIVARKVLPPTQSALSSLLSGSVPAVTEYYYKSNYHMEIK